MCLNVNVVPFRLPSVTGTSKVPGPLRIKAPDSHDGRVPVTLSVTGSRTSACNGTGSRQVLGPPSLVDCGMT